MVPPTGPLNLDVEAISGICGSISIACWVVVFSPQILENFRRSSADGLSLQFIIVWLAGDVFNILGAVLQGVLPTMIILAVYYTIADIVLLGQCFYYRGFTWHDEVASPPKAKKHRRRETSRPSASAEAGATTERTALLAKNDDDEGGRHHTPHQHHHESERRGSNWSALSPAVPFVPTLGNPHHHAHATASASTAPELPPNQPAVPVAETSHAAGESTPSGHHHHHHHRRSRRAPATSAWQAAAFNAFSMLMVCTAGVAGWYLSGGAGSRRRDDDNGGSSASDPLALNVWGQVFGYLCAVLYLGSRLPQLLLNWRRQSTDGVSMLFFLFACLGNLTYVLSILAYNDGCTAAGGAGCAPGEGRARYGRYLLVNLSWLAGSLGTLLLDMGIFLQFFLYRQVDDEAGADAEDEGGRSRRSSGSSYGSSSSSSSSRAGDGDEEDGHGLPRDQRPLLQRNISSFQS